MLTDITKKDAPKEIWKAEFSGGIHQYENRIRWYSSQSIIDQMLDMEILHITPASTYWLLLQSKIKFHTTFSTAIHSEFAVGRNGILNNPVIKLNFDSLFLYALILKVAIPSLSFDAEGKLIATIDAKGLLLVSNVNDNRTVAEMKFLGHESGKNYCVNSWTFLRTKGDWFNKCRWNPLPQSTIVNVLFSLKLFNMIDTEKKQKLLKQSITTEYGVGNFLSCRIA